jgi:hypothetical protein
VTLSTAGPSASAQGCSCDCVSFLGSVAECAVGFLDLSFTAPPVLPLQSSNLYGCSTAAVLVLCVFVHDTRCGLLRGEARVALLQPAVPLCTSSMLPRGLLMRRLQCRAALAVLKSQFGPRARLVQGFPRLASCCHRSHLGSCGVHAGPVDALHYALPAAVFWQRVPVRVVS